MRPTKLQVFVGRQAAEERHALRHHADLPLDLCGLVARSSPSMRMLPDVGASKPGQHFDGGRFSGAVGAEKSEELAGIHAQIDLRRRL